MKKKIFLLLLVIINHYVIQAQATSMKVSYGRVNLFDNVKDTVKLSGAVRIIFSDSVNLMPKTAKIVFLKAKSDEVQFTYFYSKKMTLTHFQKRKLKKYSKIIKKIFLNGLYEFYERDKWVSGKKMDFSFTFDVIPEK
jgi:hypothetical protein